MLSSLSFLKKIEKGENNKGLRIISLLPLISELFIVKTTFCDVNRRVSVFLGCVRSVNHLSLVKWKF